MEPDSRRYAQSAHPTRRTFYTSPQLVQVVAAKLIWFVAFLIIIALLAGAVYYSGILGKSPAGGGTQKIDVDIKAPAR